MVRLLIFGGFLYAAIQCPLASVEAGPCTAMFKAIMGKAESGYKSRVAWKIAYRGSAVAGSFHFFLKYLQTYDRAASFSGQGLKHFGLFVASSVNNSLRGDRQSPAPLNLLTAENVIQLPLWFSSHASNFVWSIPAAGAGYLAANVLRLPVLGNVAAAASIFAANYYSEFLLDRQIHGVIDWVDIASGLAGGIVGIRFYHWWSNRYRSDSSP